MFANTDGYNPVLIAFISVLVITPVVIRLAHKCGWLAYPARDRWHTQAVALMGGAAIFASVVTALLFESSLFLSWLFIGATIMFLTGTLDDRIRLSPVVKLLAQILAATLLLWAGYELVPALPVWASMPLTFFWIVGITNSVNMLDNMDGLSPGVAGIGLGITGGLLMLNGGGALAVLTLSAAAASLGFLFYNFNPARIFMGDSGSLFLGYMLAGSILALIHSVPLLDGWTALLVGVSLVAVPVFDTTLVTFNRLFRGISPAKGGKDHTSHRLVFLGLSDRSTVLLLWLATFFCGALAVWAFYIELIPFSLMFILMFIGFAFFGSYISGLAVYPPSQAKKVLSLANLPIALKSRVQFLGVGMDLVLIIIAFSLAHYIRFEHWTLDIEQSIMEVAPGVIILKLAVFHALGLYKSIWRHAGVNELIRVIGAVGISSLLAGMFSWIYLGGYLSISVFIIDFLLLIMLVSGARFAFKALRQIFSAYSRGATTFCFTERETRAGWL
ncbi:MAG: hypothetical protein WDZ53_10500 [Balneolales bacterium]